MNTNTKLILLLLFIFTACEKPFAPAIVATNVGYLVVEGVINSGADSTIIKLSRTVKLSNNKVMTESGANVYVESDNNQKYPLAEKPVGVYTAVGLNLPTTGKYRLHIVTANKNEYVSEFTENKITPAVDSITYSNRPSGIQVNINTHDDNNNTRYYRWDFDETWTYYSYLQSFYQYVNHQVAGRTPDSLINVCYRHATPSNSIFVATSDQLAKDVISGSPLNYVAASTGKLSHVYSILVKQYALTQDAFNYWQLLKKNTEQLGTIFDAQPSTTGGNLHCVTNPSEPVIGYISISTITTKRIFVAGSSLPFYVYGYIGPPYSFECKEGAVFIAPAATFTSRIEHALANGDSILTNDISELGTGVRVGYHYAYSRCVDCRLLGGTNIKPSYWP